MSDTVVKIDRIYEAYFPALGITFYWENDLPEWVDTGQGFIPRELF